MGVPCSRNQWNVAHFCFQSSCHCHLVFPQEKANNRRLKKGRQKDRQQNDDDEGDEGQMKVQLQKLGLELKEISGDG
jgi:hypothetical protein